MISSRLTYYFKNITYQVFTLCVFSFLILRCGEVENENDKRTEADSFEKPDNTPPNIIFLLADDQRADALSFAGNPTLQTPNIDKLAEKGVYFENAYVTTSICAVSRASILSGQYARRHDIWGFSKSFTPEQLAQTYPLILRDNGYKTGFIGKYGVGGPLPSDKYDYWEGFGGQGTFNQTDSAGNYIHLTEKIGNQMEDFIDMYKNDSNRFCLSVSFKAPHVEGDPGYFNPDPQYADLYLEDKIEKPVAATDKYFNHFPEEFTKNNVARNRWSSRFANSIMFQENVKKYYQSVYGIDVVVGRLLEKLSESGLAENTVIVYTSDNGFYLGEYGFAGKWYGSEPSIKVPMILYDPRVGQPKAMRVTGFALNIDLAPTMLSLAGLDVPSEMQGKNLYDLTRGDGNWREEFFYEHLWQSSDRYYIPSTEGIVGKRYKYMNYFMNFNPDDQIYEELYDLEADPYEINNLAENEGTKDIYTSLVDKVNNYKKNLK